MNKFCVKLNDISWQQIWPTYFDNFFNYCLDKASENKWHVDTVINYELKPYGKLIKTSTQGWYLRWEHEKYHNIFVLKWS